MPAEHYERVRGVKVWDESLNRNFGGGGGRGNGEEDMDEMTRGEWADEKGV